MRRRRLQLLGGKIYVVEKDTHMRAQEVIQMKKVSDANRQAGEIIPIDVD